MWNAARGRFGLLSFFGYCSIALLPCIIVNGWRTSPLLAIWAIGAGLRWLWGDTQILADCFMFGVVNVFWERRAIQEILARKLQEADTTAAAGSWLLISRFLGPLALIACLYRWRGNRNNAAIGGLPNGAAPWTRPHPRALIFPCQTKHARMFPKRHAFEYTYLQCGFPVVPAGVQSDGERIGGGDSQFGSWWLQIKAEDYLSRGNGVLGFYNKLKLYLQDHVCIHTRLLQSCNFPMANKCSVWTMLIGRMPI